MNKSGPIIIIEDDPDDQALLSEVFEELGLRLIKGRLSEPLFVKYDPSSAREAQQPVVAVYFFYHLNEKERISLLDIAKTDTKRHELLSVDLEFLINKKRKDRDNRPQPRSCIETICHAPLEVLETANERLDCDLKRDRKSVV